MLVALAYDGIVGYGEASLPPYLGESHHSVAAFYNKLHWDGFTYPFNIEEILAYVDQIAHGNTAAKAGIDIALHDLVGKLSERPCREIIGYSKTARNTSFTIGIDTLDMVKRKTQEAKNFHRLKIKLGADNDQEIIKSIREVTRVALCVDANQGWTDKYQALDQIEWMATQGIEFVEQPMPKSSIDAIAWLTARSPLPIIADEGVQRLADIPSAVGVYSGINIKLMKSTGIAEADKMIRLAKSLGLQTMLGCMTETSCAISAAAQLSSAVDWIDLDGNLLIDNDIFEGVKATEGLIQCNDLPGIGVVPFHDNLFSESIKP